MDQNTEATERQIPIADGNKETRGRMDTSEQKEHEILRMQGNTQRIVDSEVELPTPVTKSMDPKLTTPKIMEASSKRSTQKNNGSKSVPNIKTRNQKKIEGQKGKGTTLSP